MRILLAALALAGLATGATAMPPKPALAGLSFLVGDWVADDGQVADAHQTSRGRSTISVESDGSALLRRDRTELFDAQGKPAGAFEQTMLIFAEGGGLKADYVDGEGHVIHYPVAAVTPGRAVTFTSSGPGPEFRLTYELKDADTLAVRFGMVPPGASSLQPIAQGTLRRACAASTRSGGCRTPAAG
jgi:hypothetical protein